MDSVNSIGAARPCRLYVIMARSAPVAVVFRRGPSRWVQVLKWSTDDDTFTAGQWLHGRIYERRCDLSPDGSPLVYFAHKIGRPRTDADATDAWTAVSRPPFLSALALWPKGDRWNGGGLFDSDKHLLLNHPHDAARPLLDRPPHRRLRVSAGAFPRGEDEPIMSVRAARDGWQRVQVGCSVPENRGYRTEKPEVWQRPGPRAGTRIIAALDGYDFQAHGGPYLMSYSLVQDGLADIPIRGATWADWDQRGRLVFAREGCLLSGVPGPQIEETLLIDLNPNKPDEQGAPEWATRW